MVGLGGEGGGGLGPVILEEEEEEEEDDDDEDKSVVVIVVIAATEVLVPMLAIVKATSAAALEACCHYHCIMLHFHPGLEREDYRRPIILLSTLLVSLAGCIILFKGDGDLYARNIHSVFYNGIISSIGTAISTFTNNETHDHSYSYDYYYHNPPIPPLPDLSPLPLAMGSNCSTTNYSSTGHYLLLDGQGNVLSDGQEQVVRPLPPPSLHYHHIYILSLDNEGRLLCHGGAYYIVFVRGEYVALHPRVTDLHNGLHLIQVLVDDLLPPPHSSTSSDGSYYYYPMEVTIQLRWPNTDFATNDDIIYESGIQLSAREPSRSLTWRLVLEKGSGGSGSGGGLPSRACGGEDMKRYDDQEDQYRYYGRWVKTTPPPPPRHHHHRQLGLYEGEFPPHYLLQSDGW